MSAAADQRSFETIPYPDMEGLEEAVKEQLNEAYDGLKSWLAQRNPPAAALAAAFGRLGNLLHAYELYESAEACYKNAAQLDAEQFLWFYYLGHVYHKSGRFAEAADFYRKSLALEPRNHAARVHLGEVLLAQNRGDEAAAEFQAVLEVDPRNAAAQAHLGEIALAKGEHREAVELLAGVLERIPGANRLHYPLGMAYRGMGKLDEARRHLAQAGVVGVTVDDPIIDALKNLATGERVHLLRGRTAFAAGRYGEAANEFRQALQADPRSARVRVNLGSALGQLGDVTGAAEQYEAALRIDPGNVTAHFNLGVIHGDAGRLEAAARHFQAAIDIKYDDGEAHRRLGLVLHRLGRKQEAEESLRSATSLIPTREDVWLDHAVVLVELERYQDALDVLEKAHRILPQSGGVSHALARILADCPDASLRDGRRALDLAQRVYDARQTPAHGLTVAMALAELGRCHEAAEWQAQLIRIAEEEGATGWASRQRGALERYRSGPPCRSAHPPPEDSSP